MCRSIICCLVIWISFATQSVFAQPLTVMTYNIRYDTPRDGENQWSKRKGFLVDQLKFYAPDVFGIQEGLRHQVAYIDSSLTAYNFVGVGRDDGEQKGEYAAIFYDANSLELLEQNTFWLSERPEEISVGWDASMERICTYALFKNAANKQQFWVFNTHFDHIGEVARRKSVALILAKINSINAGKHPVILMGDLNLTPDTAPIQKLSSEMWDTREHATDLVFGPEGTFNHFKVDQIPSRRIDYVFTSKQGFYIRQYAVLTDSKALKFPSDHLAVLAKLEFKAQ